MEISEIIATYAIGLAILEGLRWGGLRGGTFSLPAFFAGSVDIFGVSVDYQRLIIVGAGILTFVLLYLFTRYTKIGLAFRGIAQDERAAMMLGINSDITAVLSLAIGSALAGLAAILLLPLGNIVVETGYNVLIFAIAVCVIGGLGSWGGVSRGIIHYRVCPDPHGIFPFRPLPDGGCASCDYYHLADQAIRHFRQAKRTGRAGVIWMQ